LKNQSTAVPFPSIEEVLLLHKTLIDKFGGIHGVRDLGLLESSLHRPQSGYYESFLDQVSALMHSLITNHCFFDGNKRMGFALSAVCLKLHGIELNSDPAPWEDFIVNKIIDEKVGVKEISDFLQSQIKPKK